MEKLLRLIVSFFVSFITILCVIGLAGIINSSVDWMFYHPMALCSIMPTIWILMSWYLYSNVLEDFPWEEE